MAALDERLDPQLREALTDPMLRTLLLRVEEDFLVWEASGVETLMFPPLPSRFCDLISKTALWFKCSADIQDTKVLVSRSPETLCPLLRFVHFMPDLFFATPHGISEEDIACRNPHQPGCAEATQSYDVEALRAAPTFNTVISDDHLVWIPSTEDDVVVKKRLRDSYADFGLCILGPRNKSSLMVAILRSPRLAQSALGMVSKQIPGAFIWGSKPKHSKVTEQVEHRPRPQTSTAVAARMISQSLGPSQRAGRGTLKTK